MDVVVMMIIVAVALTALTSMMAPKRQPDFNPFLCKYCGRLHESGDRCSRCGAWRG